MSTEEGYITKLKGSKAIIQVKRSGMCEACKSKSSCISLGGGSDMEAEALNLIQAKIGDRILVKIPSKSLWKITTLLYLIPVLFLLLGSLFGYLVLGKYFLTPELSSLLLGIIGCTISYLIIKVISNGLEKNKNYIPEIIKVL